MSVEKQRRTCTIEDCKGVHQAQGMCKMHYTRWRRHGSAALRKTTPGQIAEDWVRANVGYTGHDCLEWPFKQAKAYGHFHVKGVGCRMAHQFMCELAHGSKPFDKAVVAHTCGNSRCVNPTHLRWATQAENISDKWAHGTMPYGEKVHNARLNDDLVIQIRNSPESLRWWATKLGVGRATIRDVRRRATWVDAS